MSIKLELDADSIKQAISSHIAAQGFNLDGKHVEVALVNGRGGNGNRAMVTISDDTSITLKADVPMKSVKEIDAYVKTVIKPEEVVIIEETQEEVIPSELDSIIAASAETDPFGEPSDVMADFFPMVDPASVETPKSLF